jgi:hypothetical protein
MKNRLILMILFLCAALISCRQNLSDENTDRDKKTINIPDGIVMENETLKTVFSKENGALLCLLNKQTGWKAQNRPDLGLSFNLLVPMKDKRSNYVFGKKQKLKSYEVGADKKSITFIWDKLQSEYAGELDINLKGTVTITEEGLKFGMEIDNRSQLVVEAASYPVIGDIPQPSKEESLDLLRLGYSGLDNSSLLPYFNNQKGYYGVDYPTQSYVTPDAPFVLASSRNQGLYIGDHDTTNKEMVSFTFELKPGYGIAYGEERGEIISNEKASKETPRLEMNTWHFSFVNPGEKYATSPIQVSTYNGSWHYGANIYKEWRNTWYKAPPSPDWIKDINAWQQIQINCSEDNLLFKYKELPGYAAQCARHGVKAIQLTGWNNGGQDRNNPTHDTDPRLGSWQDLKDAIAACEKIGVHIILFNKYTWADQSTEWFRRELIKYSVKNMYGDYQVYGGYQYHTPTQINNISTRRLIPMCMLSKKWLDIADNEFKKSIDLGASGMLYDECQHHGGARYCFDETHGHHVPAYVYQGDGDLARGFRAITKKVNPGYLFAGEACYDLEYRYYSVSYFRISIDNNYIPGQRYIDSDKAIMMAIVGFEGQIQCNAALRYKYIMSYEPYYFKGQLEDFPLTIAYGEKIDELRKKYKEFLWDAEFQDILGASVTSDGKPYHNYSVFRTKNNKHAVVIVNNDENNEIEASVKLENSTAALVSATPENTALLECNGKARIPAQSVIVVMEK